jgi:tRNA pseudouridine55 synthase
LDPIAEGVLLIAVGQAVRLVDWIHLLPKKYRGTFDLGKTSPSVDTASEVTIVSNAIVPRMEEVQAILAEFRGTIAQIPPIYSAVRIAGKRAYESARAGLSVDVPARKVTIHGLSVTEFTYPKLVLDVECSTGTYIRSLGRDIARRLGTDAIMTKLLRLSIGDLVSSHAVRLEDLNSRHAIEANLCNPVECLTQFPQITLNNEDIKRLHQGNTLELQDSDLMRTSNHPEYVLALDQKGSLQSILCRNDGVRWRPYRNFLDNNHE